MATNFVKVREYFLRNREPIQALCPTVNQYFETKDGLMVWNNVTGSRESYANRFGDKHVKWEHGTVPTRSSYFGIYFRYIPEIDGIEFSRIYMKGGRGKNGEQRTWSFVPCDYTYLEDIYERNVIIRGDLNLYQEHSIYGVSDFPVVKSKGRYYNDEVVKRLMSLSIRRCVDDPEIIKREWLKYDESVSNDTYRGLWSYCEWYKKSFKERNKSQETIDALNYELPDIPGVKEALDESSYFAYFQKIDDKYAVIRMFYKRNVGYDYRTRSFTNNIVVERERCYISAKGKPIIFWNENIWGSDSCKWERKSRPQKLWGEIKIINKEDISSWKPLSYIKDLIDIKKDSLSTITTILRHPIVETLYKSGYPTVAKMLLVDDNVAANIKDCFGMEKELKGKLYKVLGVNKYLLNRFEGSISGDVGRGYYIGGDKRHSIKYMKMFYGKQDINNLSKEEIDLVFDVFINNPYILFDLFRTSRYGYRRSNTTLDISDEDRKFFFKLCRMNKKNDIDIINLYKDVKRLATSIDTDHGIDITNFRNADDIIRIHNALIEIKTREEQERRARWDERKKRELEEARKRFEKLQKERVEKYEYEDDEFCIRMPKDPNDLITEGAILHHCVGGYVNTHSNGETDIIFLRKKGYESVPFYTIEIRDGKVIQIHGSNNRWLGNNPEAIPFVREWLDKIGAKYTNNLLLNLGAGYCASPDNLPESYLFRKIVNVA